MDLRWPDEADGCTYQVTLRVRLSNLSSVCIFNALNSILSRSRSVQNARAPTTTLTGGEKASCLCFREKNKIVKFYKAIVECATRLECM